MSPLEADVKPGRCCYCGRPCNGDTCAQHRDLLPLEIGWVDVSYDLPPWIASVTIHGSPVDDGENTAA